MLSSRYFSIFSCNFNEGVNFSLCVCAHFMITFISYEKSVKMYEYAHATALTIILQVSQ